MGSIACSRILQRAARTLFDETGVRWPPAELLDYLNAGIGAIVAAKPDVAATAQPFELVGGSRQDLPQDFIQFLGLTRNLGADGATPGRAIRQVERNELDHGYPDWHSATGEAVLHYCHDRRLPRLFYVFPAAAGWVELQGVKAPAEIVDAAETLPLDDLYENPLHNWVVAYAYAKSSKSGDMNRSGAYMTLFANALGLKSQLQFSFAPTDPDVAARSGEDN
ncbi:hypothetical protein D0B54_17980 [Solimonas sp. K1W22B-7]|uniref:phage adaptor protein n=1 Tax=Solimonas sp. K1W22B-7 TaxID=2303331 RepID=UPI000E335ADC|nr:DUF6682 family protein [Solimonas sp. K1W22B-7]AXQ30450.1 hypothetical protein D0B54_17980 [Solimonas sp. K1W22B-7]